MMDDWLPDDSEQAAMARFLQREGIVIADAGTYPLVTYSAQYKQKHELPASEGELRALEHNGDHLRTAVMAARLGIPVRQWPYKLVNLATPDILQSDDWLADWNGVWIHKSHGSAGRCSVSGPLRDGAYTVKNCSGFAFYMLYAQHIFRRDGFRHGVLCVCETMRDTTANGLKCTPFLLELKENCTTFCTNKTVTLYGARGETWVPLYGPHAGEMLMAPEPFIFGPDRNQYLTGSGKPPKNPLKTFVSKEHELEIGALFSDAYYDRARFDPDRAVTPHSRDIDPRPIHWYRV